MRGRHRHKWIIPLHTSPMLEAVLIPRRPHPVSLSALHPRKTPLPHPQNSPTNFKSHPSALPLQLRFTLTPSPPCPSKIYPRFQRKTQAEDTFLSCIRLNASSFSWKFTKTPSLSWLNSCKPTTQPRTVNRCLRQNCAPEATCVHNKAPTMLGTARAWKRFPVTAWRACCLLTTETLSRCVLIH